MIFAVTHRAPRTPWLAVPLLTLALVACSDDPYERELDEGEQAYDPTEAEGNVPLDGASSPAANEEREPRDLDDAETIDPVGEPTDPPPTGEAPEEPGRPPLDHPTQATEIDPVGDPTNAALPDEPTRSRDPTESPAVDPVGEPITEENDDDDAEEPDDR